MSLALKDMRILLLGAALSLLLPGCIESLSAPAEEVDCPGHWHSTFTLFVHGERVLFTPNPAYTLEGGTMPVRTHMHRGAESLWHFEPNTGTECIPMADALAVIDIQLEPGRLEFASTYYLENELNATYSEGNGMQLQAWIRSWQGEWTPISIKELVASQVSDGSEVLVLFGKYDANDVVEFQQQAQPNKMQPR